jgi:hypothetical protein
VVAAVAAVAIVLAIVLIGGGKSSGSFSYDDPFNRFPKGGSQGNVREVGGAPDSEKQLVGFLRFVSSDVQTFWAKEFQQGGAQYRPAPVIVFHDAVQTGCGPATSAVGPFYCPLDRSVYLDLGFFRQLAVEFKAPGDFADAYVLAHEIGHHIQNLSGITRQVELAQANGLAPPNLLSIDTELQADCLAGVWAHSTYERGIADNGDVDEALRAAAAVGDDRIQAKATGRIDPETWTHGSSAQRRHWLLRGLQTGDPNACDTFAGGAAT